MRLALYQPDIAPNAGAMLRLAVCLGVPVDLIEPAGFLLSDARLRRAGMDYLDHVELLRHVSWPAFQRVPRGRLVLLSTRGSVPYHEVAYAPGDTLLVGRETSGVPDEVRLAADLSIRIPMREGMRSLNVALAAAIVLGEALHQTDGWPPESRPGDER